MKDENTIEYFDKNIPEYPLYRFNYTVKVINRCSCEDSSLVDIGCGTANMLEFLRKETPIQDLCGIDVSQNCLLKTQKRVSCETFLGSILDNNFIERIPRRFDFAILGAVLHHLVGKTRKKSKEYALLAISNSLTLLENGGYLIIFEPTFYPSISMDIVFYLKKLITKITSKRVQILGEWNNIGAPIVSYYTNEELLEMIGYINHCQIVDKEIKEHDLNFLWRLAGITRRTDTTIVVRKIKSC